MFTTTVQVWCSEVRILILWIGFACNAKCFHCCDWIAAANGEQELQPYQSVVLPVLTVAAAAVAATAETRWLRSNQFKSFGKSWEHGNLRFSISHNHSPFKVISFAFCSLQDDFYHQYHCCSSIFTPTFRTINSIQYTMKHFASFTRFVFSYFSFDSFHFEWNASHCCCCFTFHFCSHPKSIEMKTAYNS